MTSRNSNRSESRTPWWNYAAAVFTLLIAIVAVHGDSLTHGLFMDDHAHYRQLRESGWSLRELASACYLGLVGDIAQVWFMPECTLRFFRPVAFGLMKLCYTATGWSDASPMMMHVASLGWHLAACTLLMLLLLRLGARLIVAWVIAMLFAMHSAHVATVQWIASQSELMVTTFILAATLCYANFRGWRNLRAPPAESPPLRWRWGLASVFLFMVALGCRENAIMFPFVMGAVELTMWRRRGRAALGMYAILATVMIAYLLVRAYFLQGAALPPKPYIVPPADPGFVRYIFDKACYYLIGEFLMVPTVPIGGLVYLREHAPAFYGASAFVSASILAICLVNRRRIVAILGPAWLFGFMTPLLPAFESPHHLYLPGVGWAIIAMMLLEKLRGPLSAITHRATLFRECVAAFMVIGTGGLLCMMSYISSLSLDTAQRVEDRVFDEVAQAETPIRDGDTLYIANLPLIAHYVKLGVEERLGVKNLRVVALTWAPRLLFVSSPTELRRMDERTIEVWVRDDRFFSGPLGRLVREASGREMPVTAAAPVRTPDFTVELLKGDPSGIAGLRFTFDDPLPRDHVHLFWGSQTRWAYQIKEESSPDESRREAAGDSPARRDAIPR